MSQKYRGCELCKILGLLTKIKLKMDWTISNTFHNDKTACIENWESAHKLLIKNLLKRIATRRASTCHRALMPLGQLGFASWALVLSVSLRSEPVGLFSLLTIVFKGCLPNGRWCLMSSTRTVISIKIDLWRNSCWTDSMVAYSKPVRMCARVLMSQC